jgi:hypothetical protein
MKSREEFYNHSVERKDRDALNSKKLKHQQMLNTCSSQGAFETTSSKNNIDNSTDFFNQVSNVISGSG